MTKISLDKQVQLPYKFAGINLCDGGIAILSDVSIVGFDVGIIATNPRQLTANKLYIQACKTGMYLNDCWDAEFTDIHITQKINKSNQQCLKCDEAVQNKIKLLKI